MLALTSQLLFDSRQMEVSAQQEYSRLSDQLDAATPAYNWPSVSIPDPLLSIFTMAAAGVRSSESALWEGEMKERCGGEEKKRQASHCFLSLSPMNVSQVTKGTCIKELYIADK